MHKLTFIKIKHFHASEEDTTKKVKTIHRKKIFVSRTYKEVSQLNKDRKPNLKSGQKDLNRDLSKEDIQMTNQHMEDAQHHQPLGKCKSKPE